MEKKEILIVVVDDHLMFRKALVPIINQFDQCRVISESGNGIELQEYLEKGTTPDIVILDLIMPKMNGEMTLLWLQKHYPSIEVIILTMIESDYTMVRLLRAGAKAFLKKNFHPDELKNAIYSVKESGFYCTDSVTRKLFNILYNDNSSDEFRKFNLAEKEVRFLELASSDLTYKEIAREMKLSARAIDKIRDRMFFKFDVKSRVALVMKTVKDHLPL